MSRADVDLMRERKIRSYDQELSALAKTEKSIDELLLDPSITDNEKLKTFEKLRS